MATVGVKGLMFRHASPHHLSFTSSIREGDIIEYLHTEAQQTRSTCLGPSFQRKDVLLNIPAHCHTCGLNYYNKVYTYTRVLSLMHSAHIASLYFVITVFKCQLRDCGGSP